MLKVSSKKLQETDFKGNIKNKALFVCRDLNAKGIKRNQLSTETHQKFKHHMKTDIDWKLKIALENVILLNLSLEDLMSFKKIQAECTEVSYCRSQRLAASSLKRQGRGNCEEYCHAILSAKTYLL